MIEKLLEKYSKGLINGYDFLKKLEFTNNFVFHGTSISNIKNLEPRGKDLVVVASPYIDIAIFRAIVRKGRSEFGVWADGRLNFKADKEALNSTEGNVGYVYVLNKTQFKPKGKNPAAMDWRSKKSIKPLIKIKVKDSDIPKNIEVIK
jgi:hypothetical protein